MTNCQSLIDNYYFGPTSFGPLKVANHLLTTFTQSIGFTPTGGNQFPIAYKGNLDQ